MTNVANRHGLRKAAAQNRDKHAQRTQLPPRAGRVQDAKDVLSETAGERGEQLGTKTQAKLLEHARSMGLNPPKGASKGKLLNLILAQERAAQSQAVQERSEARANAKAAATLRSGRTDRTDRIDDAFSEPARTPAPKRSEQPAGRGDTKAKRLAAEMPGWKATINTSGGTTEIVLVRGAETVQICWDDGVFNYQTAHYAVQDRVIKIRNVSHAKQLMARTPEDAASDVRRAVSNKAFRRKPSEKPARRMPFDPESMDDSQLVEQLLGKGITWSNRISGTTEVAYVSRNPQKVRVTEYEGERVLHWCCPATGFRAARVAALVRVGAKVDLRTRMPDGEKSGGRVQPKRLQTKRAA